MAASAEQPSSRTAGDDRNLVTIDENYLAPTLEDRAMIFWEKHGRTVIAVVILVVAILVGRWAFDLFAESRERAIAAEYAQAKDNAALTAFAKARPQAALAGVAHLRLADAAYAAGNYSSASSDYQAAARILAGDPLADRARLGAALSTLQSGDAAGAKTALEALANDTTYSRTLRAEAAFHLAVLARDAGQAESADKWAGVTLSADPSGLWSQRALQLRATLPAAPAPAPVVAPAAAPAPAAEAPAAVSFPGAK